MGVIHYVSSYRGTSLIRCGHSENVEVPVLKFESNLQKRLGARS